jgi:hypothetical protein
MGNGFFQHGEFGPVNVGVYGHMLGGQWGGGGGAGAGRYGGDIVCSTLGSLHRGVGRGGRGEGWEGVGGVRGGKGWAGRGTCSASMSCACARARSCSRNSISFLER